ncbi:MAG: hypothetical protein EGR02_06080 [Clostridiales bacterium]|nr:hypothetical protein [Clostridiales bacterium]MBD8986867.1 hypothetical protein [Clostridiales bacterium]MDY3925679.1 hypothetical protein [Eubacteriales bacterium]
MKTYRWRIPDGDAEHTVSCALSRLRGKLRVAVDGDEFDLPAGLFGLSVARREKLLLGEQKALLVLDRAGHASLAVEGEQIPPEA